MTLAYYQSRYKGRTYLGRNITFGGAYLLLAINYYYSGGLGGPSLLYFMFTYFAVVSITPRSELPIHTIAGVLIVTFLIVTELITPEIIIFQTGSLLERAIDMWSAYLLSMVMFGTSARFLITSYNKERNLGKQQLAVLKVLDEERSQLLSVIGHDLRAPLNNIHGYLDLAEDMAIEERQVFHEHLASSTKTTMELLDNLLHWTHNRMSGVADELREHYLLGLTQVEYNLLSKIAQKKDIAITLNIPAKMSVIGNDNMIRLIVRNLLYNAIKFTNPGGNISIKAKTIGNTCALEISDTGTGSYVKLPADLKNLKGFSNHGTHQEKGSGLGLKLCWEFAEAQNGTITYESKVSGGSKFTLHLPCRPVHLD
ncbi:sensor histidine kinase [Mucilaginibacter ginkgonis]|uniref:histidine kinase n=1 Tax=Mucilaginibacter ginkgonis TaxID=2682091 RepID=A0A6I4HZD3_9SPHI|nr:HAMP domain-containing sensor histidine kinase [Mucilaginibacter ginkgonis]QQL50182.1 HAMP domain-containing histidine kinase [Mucilaginibacter ginkgonis]